MNKMILAAFLLTVALVVAGFTLGFMMGQNFQVPIVKMDLNYDVFNAALEYHGLENFGYDGTFYFKRNGMYCSVLSNGFRSWYAKKVLEEEK